MTRSTALTRFKSAEVDPSSAVSLRADHPALAEARTLFPTTVVGSMDSPRLLVSGHNNPKLGKEVQKGERAGWPIYHLTLEERATCPRSCVQWAACLTPDSRVLTADFRWVRLDEVQEGDRICGFDENIPAGQRKTRISTVEKLGRITQPSYRIVTDRGAVTASIKHLWLAQRGGRTDYRWRPTDALKIGDRLQYFGEPWDVDQSYDAGRLRGFVEGEGTCGVFGNNGFAKSRLSWAQRPTKLCDEIEVVANLLGFQTARATRVAGVNQSEVCHVDVLGGWREVVRFLGRIRPTRMIEKAEEIWANHAIGGRGGQSATVLAIEPIGETEVITIQTSTRTMVAEGFFTHNCYGNAMPQARRHAVDADFLELLKAEVATVARQHPKGLLIRLHTLGDFYSGEYVMAWAELLMRFPQVHVFGYTARRVDDEDRESARIARAIAALTTAMWSRFAIRTSHPEAGPQRSIVVDAPVERADVIMCPAQVEKTAACATCGLCWVDACRDKTIAFLRHGMSRKRGPRDDKPVLSVVGDELQNPPGEKIRSSVGNARRAEAVTGDSPVASAPKIIRPPSTGQEAVHAAMLRLANADGVVAVHRVALAAEADVAFSTVQALVGALIDRGLVEMLQKGGGRGRTSIYRVRRAEDPPFGSFRSDDAPQDPPKTAPETVEPPRPPVTVARAPEPRQAPAPREVDEADFVLEPEAPPTPGACTLMNLRRNQCHWPVGEPRPVQLYCAEPSRHGEEYCPVHQAEMYGHPPPRKSKPLDPREADRRAEAARARRTL